MSNALETCPLETSFCCDPRKPVAYAACSAKIAWKRVRHGPASSGIFALRASSVVSQWSVILALLSVIHTGLSDEDYPRLSLKDREFLERLPTPRAALPAGFKVKYVGQGGVIKDTKQSSGHWIEIGGSPLSSDKAVYEAALIVSLQSRHMPSDVFNRLASRASIGVFNKPEKITVYPEFYHLKDTPECHGKCSGSCSHTCTFDGRKWESVGGAGGIRAVILEDNIMCTSHDPHHHRENIVVHEFGHSVQKYGMDSAHISKVLAAYNHAKAAGLWTHNAYAMANYKEYFAEASTAFFNVNKQTSAAGMNKCGHGGLYCDTEAHARTWLKGHDPQLFDLLSYVYTNNHPDIPGNIKICESL